MCRYVFELSGLNLVRFCHFSQSVLKQIRGFFKKFPHFYNFAGNGEGGRSSNWSCLRVSCD